jgi:hypothetical protein
MLRAKRTAAVRVGGFIFQLNITSFFISSLISALA